MIEKIAQLNHDLNRMRGIDRDSFFGRLEILEWTCEETHTELGERWRKLGRYGNIVLYDPFIKALARMKNEYEFTREEMQELLEWTDGQGKTYGNPDQLVAGGIMKGWIEKNYP